MISLDLREQELMKILEISGELCIHDFCTIRELAIFMHDVYESIAKKEGWNTQKQCQVAFEDLPEKNKQVMLFVAKEIYEKYIKEKGVEREKCLKK